MTAFGQIDQAVALVRAGAQDYLTKPFELASLFQKVRDVLSLRVRDGAQGALGVSRSMCGIEALLRRLASRSLPILFTGETGTEGCLAGSCMQFRPAWRSHSWP